MAPKSILFLFVSMLVVTRMGSSVNVPPPTEAPIYAPTTAPTPPTYAPTSPLPWGFGTACTAMCAVRCRPQTARPFRACQKVCTACCAKSRCVPNFSKCGCEWETVTIRGNTLKCP